MCESAERIRCNQWDHGISKGSEPVNPVSPTGKPISHSTNAGFSLDGGVESGVSGEDVGPSVELVWIWREKRETISGRSGPPSWYGQLPLWSLVVGVGHITPLATASVRLVPGCPTVSSPEHRLPLLLPSP